MEQLKYSQVLDYVLGLVRLVKKNSPNSYLNLEALLAVLSYNASFAEITEIAEYLEAKGYLKVIYQIGEIMVQITSQGMLHVEELGAEFEEKFDAYMAEISKKETISLQLFEGSKNPKEKVLKLVDSIKNQVREKKGEGSDYLLDLDVLKFELQKMTPDFRVIEMKMENLRDLNFLIEEIVKLRNYLVHT